MGINVSKIICSFELVNEKDFQDYNGEIVYEGDFEYLELNLFDVVDWEEISFESDENQNEKVYALRLVYIKDDSETEVLVNSTVEDFEDVYYYYFDKDEEEFCNDAELSLVA